MPASAQHSYEFGRFRLEPGECRLLRNGVRVSVPPKAFDILVLLVRSRGHMLAKEELMKAVWPETFVEESNLTHYISVLRRVLEEEQNKAACIETIPRVGYRFIAEVREVPAKEAQLIWAKHTRTNITVEEEHEEEEAGPESSAQHSTTHAMPAVAQAVLPVEVPRAATRSRARLWTLLAGTILIAALAGSAAYLYFSRPGPLTERDSVLLADFVNTTGEPVFDGALKQALAVKLDESPFLNVVPEQRVRETLRFMGRSPDERVTASVAQEVCERRSIKAMLTGSIASVGSHYVIALEAVNCATGDSLAREQVEAESREQVLRAMGAATSSLRRKLGESLASIKKFDAPIEEATTPSLEALKAFSVGEALRAKGGITGAIPSYERAIELDHNFALAYGRLGSIYVNVGEPGRAAEYKKKAFELRQHVSERERLYITALYYHTVTAEIDKTLSAYEVWERTYPRDFEPYNNAAGQHNSAGQFARALEEGRIAMQLNPNNILPYAVSGWAALGLNRYDEAKGIFEQAFAHKIESPNVHRGLYAVAFAQGDSTAMQRQTDWARGTPDEFRMLNFEAQGAAFLGELQRARLIYRESVGLAQKGKFNDNAASTAAGGALTEAHIGNYRQARADALAALAISRPSDALAIAAAALALSGDARQAQLLTEELARRYPADTLVNSVSIPAARAAIELHNGEPAKAIELLQPSIPYELGPFVYGQGYLPIYLRGQAYLRLGKGSEAAAEFQKILDHRGAAPCCPLYPLAHLGVARASLLFGDKAKSKQAYENFFALWKNADADVPILQSARAEYARATAAQNLESGSVTKPLRR